VHFHDSPSCAIIRCSSALKREGSRGQTTTALPTPSFLRSLIIMHFTLWFQPCCSDKSETQKPGYPTQPSIAYNQKSQHQCIRHRRRVLPFGLLTKILRLVCTQHCTPGNSNMAAHTQVNNIQACGPHFLFILEGQSC
jgi:hypothetical protein